MAESLFDADEIEREAEAAVAKVPVKKAVVTMPVASKVQWTPRLSLNLTLPKMQPLPKAEADKATPIEVVGGGEEQAKPAAGRPAFRLNLSMMQPGMRG